MKYSLSVHPFKVQAFSIMSIKLPCSSRLFLPLEDVIFFILAYDHHELVFKHGVRSV